MEYFRVEGGRPLEGTVRVQGAKNSALPLLAATLLARGETVLRNCPELTDVAAALDILACLGCRVGREGDTVRVPSWRGDVEHYSDLAEEVARLYGYNEIPTRFTGSISTAGGLTPEQQCERRVGEICRSLGLDEIITYSFISPSYYDRIRLPEDSPLRRSLRILNPLGEDTSIMRTTTLPSMLEILTKNYNVRNREAYLYEIGRTYLPREDGLADEPKTVSLGAYGPGVNFFTVKGWCETLLEGLGIEGARCRQERENPSWHPGRCATLWVGDSCIGTLGQIHPKVMKNYGVDAEFYCAELSFGELLRLRGGTPVFRALPRFPAVTRDLAVLCDLAIPVGDLRDAILENGGEYLKECAVFDVYTGRSIMDGKKSVAFSLTMRAEDQTLTDEHAEETVARVLNVLKERFGAEIR